MRKKQNDRWKLSDTNWFYFSFYNPIWFFLMIWVDPSPILFYFYFFIRSELLQVDLSWSDPDWRYELIRSDFCTCLKITVNAGMRFWPTWNRYTLLQRGGFPQWKCIVKDICTEIIFMKYKEEIQFITTLNEFLRFHSNPSNQHYAN